MGTRNRTRGPHGFLGLDFCAMLDRPELPTVLFRSDGPRGWTADPG